MPGETDSSASKRPVVSQFFATKPAGRRQAPLQKKASVISLSSSDAETNNGDDDGDIEIIEARSVPANAPLKRKEPPPSSSSIKASSSATSSKRTSSALPNGQDDAPSKRIKVAPLFERTKNATSLTGPAVKKEEPAAVESVKKLQQWKFATPVSATGEAAASDANDTAAPIGMNGASRAVSSSSPLPEVPGTASKPDAAVQARRAHVRKMLLGINTEWRKPPEDEATASTTNWEDAMEDDGDAIEDNVPVASTSKAGAANGKTSKSSSQFAKFASLTKESTSSAKSSSKKSTKESSKGKGKGKAKDEPEIKYTPLEQQVLDIRERYPDTILIVEVGYKFKFFGEDAKIAARELNIACFMSQNFYTAMIPAHRVQIHIKRLITSGYKVGIVRQRETAALKKVGDNRNAPFTRELTDLYTSATYVEGLDDDTVSGAAPTFGTLLCLCEESRGGKGSDEKVLFGLVSAQPSTGQVIYDQFEDGFLRAELETRLLHIQPGELVMQGPISAPTKRVITYLLSQETIASGTGDARLTESRTTLSSAEAVGVVSKFYATPSTSSSVQGKSKDLSTANGHDADDAIDLSDSEDTLTDGEALAMVLGLPAKAIVALAGLINHLSEFSLQAVFARPKYFTPFAQRGHMLLNANTIANLEIFRNQTNFKEAGSLFSILDHTKTPFGQRLLRRWVAKPLLQKAALQERIDAVDEILESQSYLLGKLRGLLRGLPDLERGLARIHYGKSSPQELLRVLSAFQRIGDEFQNMPKDLSQSSVGFRSSMINEAFYAFPRVKPLVDRFLGQINATKAREGDKANMWQADFQPEELTDCKDVFDTAEAEIQDHLQECRKLLRKPALQYITVAQEEYLLEVRITEASVIPDDWIRINGTKTVYRYRSPRLQALLQERDQAAERLGAEADHAHLQLLSAITAEYEGFRDAVTRLATLDALNSLAMVGLSPGYVKPVLVDEQCLEIVAGRHPVVETVTERPFIPNDVAFKPGGLRSMVITGCNMSGKSSFSRMVALLVIMAQIGCRIPCDAARLGIVDYIGTRFGASDEIARGRSTFMVELTETCEIIKAATPRSLVVLDELGRGTSTNDGLAIAHAVLQYLIKRIKCTALFITHFPQLIDLAQRYHEQCQVFQMAYREEEGIDRVPDITFLYKLVSSSRCSMCSYGGLAGKRLSIGFKQKSGSRGERPTSATA